VIERCTIVAQGPLIDVQDLPTLPGLPSNTATPTSDASPATVGLTAGMTVEAAERELIAITLASTGGNKTRAAEMLGISLKTLHNKLNRLDLRPKGPESD
jgi:DNA-binding NtrC family response regulator